MNLVDQTFHRLMKEDVLQKTAFTEWEKEQKPKAEPEIPAALSRLENRVEALKRVTGKLLNRLAPACHSMKLEGVGDDKAPPSQTELGARIKAVRLDLDTLHRRLKDTLNALEL